MVISERQLINKLINILRLPELCYMIDGGTNRRRGEALIIVRVLSTAGWIVFVNGQNVNVYASPWNMHTTHHLGSLAC